MHQLVLDQQDRQGLFAKRDALQQIQQKSFKSSGQRQRTKRGARQYRYHSETEYNAGTQNMNMATPEKDDSSNWSPLTLLPHSRHKVAQAGPDLPKFGVGWCLAVVNDGGLNRVEEIFQIIENAPGASLRPFVLNGVNMTQHDLHLMVKGFKGPLALFNVNRLTFMNGDGGGASSKKEDRNYGMELHYFRSFFFFFFFLLG